MESPNISMLPAIAHTSVCLATGSQLSDLASAIENNKTCITAHPYLSTHSKGKLTPAPLLYAPIHALDKLSINEQNHALLKPLLSLLAPGLHYKLLLTIPDDEALNYESLHNQLMQRAFNVSLYRPTDDIIDDVLKLHASLTDDERLIVGGIDLSADDDSLLNQLGTSSLQTEINGEDAIAGMGSVFIIFKPTDDEDTETKPSLIFNPPTAASEIVALLKTEKIPPENIKAQWLESPLRLSNCEAQSQREQRVWQADKAQTPSAPPKSSCCQTILGDLGPLNSILTIALAEQQSLDKKQMVISWLDNKALLHT